MKRYTVLAIAVFSCIFSIASRADVLVKDDIGFRFGLSGEEPTGWYQESEGAPWYYFNGDGYAHTGWLTVGGTKYYLRPENGAMIADRTTTIDGHVYRFDSSGAATQLSDSYTGWMLDDVNWYYRFSDGSFASEGWRTIDGDRYCFDADGYMRTGLIKDGDAWYYLDESGRMVRDTTVKVNGVSYTFDSSGAASWPYKEITRVAPDQEELWQTVSAMADSVLSGIVNDEMSERQKAEAIFAWVRGSFTYSGHSATRNWVEEAYNGFRRRHGDCFSYYSTSAALLMRCGIPCIEVVRYTDNGHYWNLVQIEGNWWHFDATPRRTGGYFCLWTDAQMLGYSAKHNGCFAFNRSLYPATP